VYLLRKGAILPNRRCPLPIATGRVHSAQSQCSASVWLYMDCTSPTTYRFRADQGFHSHQYYFPTSIWPEPIRTPLKAAIKAKNRGDVDQAKVYYRQAIDAALSIPSTSLAPEALLKVSGIYISLSSMLENASQSVKAYDALRDASHLFNTESLAPDANSRTAGTWANGMKLSEGEHIRAIGLYQKLGQLALQISTSSTIQPYPTTSQPDSPQTWSAAAEHYLSSALTAMLRRGLVVQPASPERQIIVGRDIDLPGSTFKDEVGRVDKRGLGMTMESLSEVYARKGQYALAGQLLLQAVSTLLPPQAKESPPIADQCQGRFRVPPFSIANRADDEHFQLPLYAFSSSGPMYLI